MDRTTPLDTTGGAAAPTAGEPQGGILRKHGRAGRTAHGGPRAVRWRPVLVADAEKSSGTGGGAGENVARNPCLTFALALRDLRMWLLSYELVLIPLRFSLAGMVIGSPVLTVLDIFVDICEILLNETIAVRTNLPVLYAAQNGLPPPVRDDDSTTFGAYSTARMLLDILTIGLLHCGRAVYFLTGDHQLFVYAQFVRTRRVFDLSAHVQALNSNLATNVRFLSSFKFALVLFSVPHWCACLWLCVTSWGPMGAGRVQLPAWPAQIQLEADNPAFEPNAQTYAERYLSGTLMAYSGLGALGYTVMLTRTDEIFLALAIAVVQIVFFAFVLGTLFNYLVRTDENTVAYKALMKAVDEFTLDRRLPPPLVARISAHFRFQHSKQSSTTDRIFAQMPKTLQTEVASAQYAREMQATWVFNACTPQFLSAIVLQLRERYMPPRELLFKRGDGALELLWCVGGTLHVKKGDVLVGTVRADIGPGQVVGELAFFAGIPQPYTVNASAQGEVTLVVLPALGFDEIVASYPEQLETIMQTVLRRYGLDPNGSDYGAGAALAESASARGKEEEEEFAALRESVRAVIIERNEERLAQMHAAVQSADVETMRALCAAGFDPNMGDYDKRTALHVAAAVGHVAVATLLLELGASHELVDRWGNTPIRVAVDKRHAGVVSALLSSGAVLHYGNPSARLHAAVRSADMDWLQMLIGAGVDVNATDHDLRTGLHFAAADGNVRVAEYLIGALADVNAADRFGSRPLDEAIDAEQMVVTQLLVRSSARPDKRKLAPKIRRAAMLADTNVVRFLVDMGVSLGELAKSVPHYDGRSALHYAALSGSASTVSLLLGTLVDVDKPDGWGRPALIDALETSDDISALLVRAGATLPPELAADGALAGAFRRAEELNVYPVIREVGRKLRLAQELRARANTISREMEVSCSGIAEQLSALLRARRALVRTLERQAPVWIATYADDDQADLSGSDPSEGSDEDSDASEGSLRSGAAGGGRRGRGRGRARSGGSGGADSGDGDTASAEAAVRHIMRLVLNLPKVEAGLGELRALFQSRLAKGARLQLSDSARRAEEHAALEAMLTTDLRLSQSQSDAIFADIYTALGRLFAASGAPAPAAPQPPPARADEKGAGAAPRAAPPELVVVTSDGGSEDGGDRDEEPIFSLQLQLPLGGAAARGQQDQLSRLAASPAACALLRSGGPFALLAFCGAVRKEARQASLSQSRRDSRLLRMRERKASTSSAARRSTDSLDGNTLSSPAGDPSSCRSSTASFAALLSATGGGGAGGASEHSGGGGGLGGAQTLLPVFLSDLGWAVLFTSPRLIELLAKPPARRAEPQSAQSTARRFEPPRAQASALLRPRRSTAMLDNSEAAPRAARLSAAERETSIVSFWHEPSPSPAARFVRMLSRASRRESFGSLDSAPDGEAPAGSNGGGARNEPRADALAPADSARQPRTSRGGDAEPETQQGGGTPSGMRRFTSRLSLAAVRASRRAQDSRQARANGDGGAADGAGADGRAQESVSEELREATAMICSFFDAFDPHGSGAVDLRALRSAHALLVGGKDRQGKGQGKGDQISGEEGGSGEIRSFYKTLVRSSRALALATPESHEAARRDSRRRDSSDDDHGPDDGAPRSPAAAARAHGLRRGRRLGKLQFMVGVSAWVASTLAEEVDEEQDGLSEGSRHSLDENGELRAAGEGAGSVGLDLASLNGGVRREVGGGGSALGESAAAFESAQAALRESFSAQGALPALADSILQRISQGRVPPDALPTAAELLPVAHHTLSISDRCRPKTLAVFFERELGIELASGAPAGGTDALRIVENAPSWHTLARMLTEKGRYAGEHKKGMSAAEVAARTSAAAASGGAAGALGGGHAGEHLHKPWYILSVSSKAHARLHALFLAVAALDCLFVPLLLSFIGYSAQIASLRWITLAFDGAYWLYILLRFHTSFINSKSVEIFGRKECVAAYLSGNFALDVVAALPLSLAALSAGSSALLYYEFRLVRLVNARYLWQAYQRWKRSISDGSLISGVISIVGVLGLMLHLLACLLQQFAIPPIAEPGVPKWIDRYYERRTRVNGFPLDGLASPEAGLANQYLVCVFYVMQLITAMGTDQLPSNYNEMGFYVFILLLNMTVYAWVVGQLSTIVMRQDDEVVSKRAQLELVNSYIASIRVPKELKLRLTKLFRARLKSTSLSSVPAEVIYAGLPMELQIEVASHTYRAVVEETTLLRGCSASFIDRLSSLLSERTLEGETVIYQTAEACNELVFVAAGSLQVYDDPEPGSNEIPSILASYGVGDTLDDIAFIANIRHVSNARTAPDVETKLFVLTRRAWRELLKTFPGQEDIIMENAISAHDGAGAGSTTNRSGRSARSAQSRDQSEKSTGNSSTRSAQQGETENRLQAVVSAAKQKRAEMYHGRLCSACARGEIDEVKKMLKGTAVDLNTIGPSGRTALHLGACGGNVQVIRLLIAARADMNAVDTYGSTPLADALSSGHLEAATLIAKHGGGRGATKYMAVRLCDAARRPNGVKRLRALSVFGGDLNEATAQKRTAMHIAAAEGQAETLAFLLESGANVNAQDATGVTPLQEAARARTDAAADALLKHGATLGVIDAAIELNNAIFDKDTAHLARLIRCRCDVNSADDFGRTPLHVAVSCKRMSSVHFLLEQEDIDVNLEDVYGHTPHDDAERVEAALETKVLVTLMRAAGGRAGSGASRTHMQEFRKGGLEEKRLETWSELLETRQKRLRDVRSLEMWVQEQIASVNGMRALVDESIALEREQGSVLVEKKPALFEALHDFGDAQRMQAAAAARARDMAEGWADGTEEGGRTGFGGREANTSNRRAFRRVLYSKLNELVMAHDADESSAASPFARLQQTVFRLPTARQLRDGSEADGAAASSAKPDPRGRDGGAFSRPPALVIGEAPEDDAPADDHRSSNAANDPPRLE